MTKLPKAKNPFTPTMRRFLADVFKPAPTLGKRCRDEDDEGDGRVAATRLAAASAPTPAPACVALQNEDPDEDAVVITALNVIPFCCHADLLTMPRTHLERVAHTLNAKLPRALQIDVAPARTDAYVRNAIELLVGLRRAVPPAPRASREAREPQSPASPLAHRSRSHISLGSPPLGVVREEDGEDASPGDVRVQKRRRTGARENTGRPLARAQSSGVAVTDAGSPTPTGRILRTRSERLPARKPTIHPNVTLTRGRSSRGYLRSKSIASTSTPVKRARRSGVDSVARTNSGAVTSTPRARGPSCGAGGVPAKKRTVADFSTSEDTAEMTFGINGMTIRPADSSSDMEVSMD